MSGEDNNRNVSVRALGAGNMAASSAIGQSNYMIECWDGERRHLTLVDCGNQCSAMLERYRYNITEIDAIVITHTDADHFCGLAALLQARRFTPGSKPPVLYLSASLAPLIWDKHLELLLSTFDARPATLEEFCTVRAYDPNRPIDLLNGTATLEMIQMVHSRNRNAINPCYGLMLTTSVGIKMFYSGDTRFVLELLMPYWKMATFIIQDGNLGGTSCQGVHACLADIAKEVVAPYRPKMWIGHYEDSFRKFVAEVENLGLLGLVQPGWVFDLNDPSTYAYPWDPLAQERRYGERRKDWPG